jgi:hypothetical protein
MFRRIRMQITRSSSTSMLRTRETGQRRSDSAVTSMSQRVIQEALQASMQQRGWLLRRVCGLRPAFVRDCLVTPYFHCSKVRRTANDNYAIEGGIGVLHMTFEKLWAERTRSDAHRSGFGVVLDITNLRELSEKKWIAADGDATDVESFCTAVAEVLAGMPGSEQDLVEAFRSNRLYTLPVAKFSGFAHRPKFHAFREFVTAL